ncbi:hypothetical protein AB6N16_25410 [Pseudomonas marginalis]
MKAGLFSRFSIGETLALLIAALGLAITIYQFISTEKISLQVKLESSISLLQDDPILKDDLKILYRGEPAPGISRADFLIANNGNKSISSSEIVVAPTITFDKSLKILSAKTAALDPPNMAVTISIANEGNAIRIAPDLLNPTDYIRVVIYLSAPMKELPEATARINGLKKLILEDARPEKTPVKGQISWTTYLVGFFVVMSLALLIPMTRETKLHRIVRRKLKNNNELLTALESPSDFRHFIADNLSFCITEEKNTINKHLAEYEESNNEASKQKLTAFIRSVITDTGGAEIAFFFLLPLITIGSYFIYTQLY